MDATYLYDGPPPTVREFTEVRGNTRKYAEYVGRMNELRAKMEGNTRVE